MEKENIMKRYIIVALGLLATLTLLISGYTQQEKDNYVVLGYNDGLTAQIVAKGSFKFIVVKTNDTKRFSNGIVPMLDEGKIDQLYISKKNVPLVSKTIKNGFIQTKDYGKIRLLGVQNPFDMWVTHKQKEKLLKAKLH